MVLPAPAEELPHQPVRVAGVIAGRDAGYHEMKGVAEALERALRVQLEVAAAPEPFLHPGRSARLGAGGTLGELHPLVAREFGMEEQVSLFDRPHRLETPIDTALPRRGHLPAGSPGYRRWSPPGHGRRGAGGDPRPAVSCWRRPTFDTYRGEQVGRAPSGVPPVPGARSHAHRCRADTVNDTIVALRGRLGGELR